MKINLLHITCYKPSLIAIKRTLIRSFTKASIKANTKTNIKGTLPTL